MNAQRVGEAEENAGAGGVKRIVAREHHCDDSDPTAPSAHVLGENADRAERELRAGKSGQRSREDNRDNTVRATSTPKVSAASGASPTPLNLRPAGVLNRTTATTAVSAQAIQVRAGRRPSRSPGRRESPASRSGRAQRFPGR